MSFEDQDPLQRYGPALVGVLIAVMLSTLIAAMIGGAMPGDYTARATVYTVLVIWIVVGAVVLFVRTARAEPRPISLRLIGMWTVSLWVWPVLFFAQAGAKPENGGDAK